MTINTHTEIIIVPKEIIETLIELKRLLILYDGISKHEEEMIYLLTQAIERICEDGKGNSSIEGLISKYNYPTQFDQEEIKESFNVEPFFMHESLGTKELQINLFLEMAQTNVGTS